LFQTSSLKYSQWILNNHGFAAIENQIIHERLKHFSYYKAPGNLHKNNTEEGLLWEWRMMKKMMKKTISKKI
jgi:hypothetical protein